MLISNDIFAAFLKCETKAHLYSSGHIGAHSEFTDWREHLQKEFSKRSRERLSVNVPAEKWLVGTPPLLTLKERRYRVIIDYEAIEEIVALRIAELGFDLPLPSDEGVGDVFQEDQAEDGVLVDGGVPDSRDSRSAAVANDDWRTATRSWGSASFGTGAAGHWRSLIWGHSPDKTFGHKCLRLGLQLLFGECFDGFF